MQFLKWHDLLRFVAIHPEHLDSEVMLWNNDLSCLEPISAIDTLGHNGQPVLLLAADHKPRLTCYACQDTIEDAIEVIRHGIKEHICESCYSSLFVQ